MDLVCIQFDHSGIGVIQRVYPNYTHSFTQFIDDLKDSIMPKMQEIMQKKLVEES